MAPGIVDHASLDEETRSNSHPAKPTVYMIDKLHPEAVRHAQDLFHVVLPTDPEIQNWQSNAEYLLVKGSYITAEQIQKATKLRAMGKQGVGLEKIDLEACSQAGVRVFNTPGVNASAVAELVLALTMAVAREIGSIQVRQASGERVHKETCQGLILQGKTLGLIGMGNISHAVARIFRGAFNSPIVAYDPFLPAGAWQDVPHKRVETIDEILCSSDVVSIHVPLTSETRDLITTRELGKMKSSAILINAARGGIVNEHDLATALEEGAIWGAGVDSHEEEPPSKERYERLWSHRHVVSTPHIGAATAETQILTAKAAVDNLYNYIVSAV
jgi:phosphoglycerate dehydrogenase-like enzyme